MPLQTDVERLLKHATRGRRKVLSVMEHLEQEDYFPEDLLDRYVDSLQMQRDIVDSIYETLDLRDARRGWKPTPRRASEDLAEEEDENEEEEEEEEEEEWDENEEEQDDGPYAGRCDEPSPPDFPDNSRDPLFEEREDSSSESLRMNLRKRRRNAYVLEEQAEEQEVLEVADEQEDLEVAEERQEVVENFHRAMVDLMECTETLEEPLPEPLPTPDLDLADEPGPLPTPGPAPKKMPRPRVPRPSDHLRAAAAQAASSSAGPSPQAASSSTGPSCPLVPTPPPAPPPGRKGPPLDLSDGPSDAGTFGTPASSWQLLVDKKGKNACKGLSFRRYLDPSRGKGPLSWGNHIKRGEPRLHVVEPWAVPHEWLTSNRAFVEKYGNGPFFLTVGIADTRFF